MYGIINKSIGELVISKYGASIWHEILEASNIPDDSFLTNEAYDDEITFTLATNIASRLQVSVGQVLLEFGKWWIMHTCKSRYAAMMRTGGIELGQFLENLPVFHDRVQLMYPKLSPPEFKVIQMEHCHYQIFYCSTRLGLKDFMKGLLLGLGEYFEQDVLVGQLDKSAQNGNIEVFEISWKEKK